MGRWEHTVRVIALPGGRVALVCPCGWATDPEPSPTLHRLTQIAQEHRREREQP